MAHQYWGLPTDDARRAWALGKSREIHDIAVNPQRTAEASAYLSFIEALTQGAFSRNTSIATEATASALRELSVGPVGRKMVQHVRHMHNDYLDHTVRLAVPYT
jgi:hypothetical protein